MRVGPSRHVALLSLCLLEQARSTLHLYTCPASLLPQGLLVDQASLQGKVMQQRAARQAPEAATGRQLWTSLALTLHLPRSSL